MSFLVYNTVSLHIHATCDTLGGAKRSAVAINKRRARAEYPREGTYVTGTRAEYDALDIEVPTYNMLDPERRVIMIRKSLKGGCCDPATETYHST